MSEQAPGAEQDLGVAAASFIDRAARPPERLYYTLLFTSPARREVLGAAVAIRHELIDSSVAAPEVAGTRLAWWGEELTRLAAGRPRHPLTRLLMARGDEPVERLAALLAEMVGAAQAASLQPLPDALEALEHRLAHDWGALCRLLCRLLGADGESDEGALAAWAGNLGLANALLDYGWTAAHRERGRRVLRQAVMQLGAEARVRQAPLLVLASLTARAYAALPEQGPDESPGTGTVAAPTGRWTALREELASLWRAWRAAGQANRGRLPGNLTATEIASRTPP